jgi:hypothetical protein
VRMSIFWTLSGSCPLCLTPPCYHLEPPFPAAPFYLGFALAASEAVAARAQTACVQSGNPLRRRRANRKSEHGLWHFRFPFWDIADQATSLHFNFSQLPVLPVTMFYDFSER